MDYGRGLSEGIKIFLALLSVGLVVSWPTIAKRFGKQWLKRAVVVLSLLGVVNYGQLGLKAFFVNIDAYDVIHYYLGAKYFDEVGYNDLYPALLLADEQEGTYDKRAKVFRFEDETGYHGDTPIERGIEHGRIVREKKFSDDRWRSFQHDFVVLQRQYGLGHGGWRNLINDRGFNGTPAWIFIARPIADVISVENAKVFCFIDVFFLALALFFARWAYGTKTALFGLLFLSVTYSLRWPFPSQAFLRYDWIAYLVMAMALLKKQRHFPAGALAGLSTLMRLFPAVWMFGPFVKGVWGLIETKGPLHKRVNMKLVMLALGFVTSLAVVEGATALALGTEPIASHFTGINDHLKPEELTSRRVGFAIAMVFTGSDEPKYLSREQKRAVADQKNVRTVLALILLGALGTALRRRDDDEAFAYGAIGFFMLTTASYYYFVARLTLVIMHAADLSRRRNRIGLAFLFGLEVMSNAFQVLKDGHRVLLVGWLSWGLVAYAVLMTVLLFLDQRAEDERARGQSDDDGAGVGARSASSLTVGDGASS